MDFSKYSFEKLSSAVCPVVPGFVALLIHQLAAPNSFVWFIHLEFFGYSAKIVILVLVAFIVGYSMNVFLGSILGGIGSYVGVWLFKPSDRYDVAPWRDPRWRNLLKDQLGSAAPNDTVLIRQPIFEQRRLLIDHLPEHERPVAIAGLELERINTVIDDGHWREWYDHYKHILLLEEPMRDPAVALQRTIAFNLEIAGLYALVSAFFVPALRHWWCILPAIWWVVILIARNYSEIRAVVSAWSGLAAQIKYLTEHPLGSLPSKKDHATAHDA
jgi:hypothetical protein